MKTIAEIIDSLEDIGFDDSGVASYTVGQAIRALQAYKEIKVGVYVEGGCVQDARATVPMEFILNDVDNLKDCPNNDADEPDFDRCEEDCGDDKDSHEVSKEAWRLYGALPVAIF